MLRILKQPKWIALTITLLIAIYAFINLSEWQFNRNQQRVIQNNEITRSLNQEPIKIRQASQLNQLEEWQTVELSGNIINSEIRFARKRYLESSLGFWVISPFEINDQEKVLVNLGFIPVSFQQNLSQINMTSEPLILKGWIRKLESHRNTPSDYPEKQISSISFENFNVNNDRFYVQISESSLDLNPIIFLPKPELSSGPHLSYAIQWIIFAILLPIGWIILYRSENTK